jgi:membrane-bound metal-dependent hydrolase YbcI (DUF457 family)
MHYAHLPAGYITSKILFSKFEKSHVAYRTFMFWGMFGSIAPDMDLIFSAVVDQFKRYHHDYITHYPMFWLTLLLMLVLWLHFDHKHRKSTALAFIFILGGFIHTLLDFVVGPIYILRPIMHMDHMVTLANRLPINSNYLELLVFLWAIFLLKKNQILKFIARLGSSVDMIE